jgi:hypothetical protein
VGQTSADIERELAEVRSSIATTVEELEWRARSVFDLKGQARDHPRLAAGAGALVLGGAVFTLSRALAERRAARRPVNRLRRRRDALAGELTRRLQQARDRTQDQTEPRNRGRRQNMNEQPNLIKTLLWMALTAGTVALAGLLARRVSSALWEAVMHEPPPTARV